MLFRMCFNWWVRYRCRGGCPRRRPLGRLGHAYCQTVCLPSERGRFSHLVGQGCMPRHVTCFLRGGCSRGITSTGQRHGLGPRGRWTVVTWDSGFEKSVSKLSFPCRLREHRKCMRIGTREKFPSEVLLSSVSSIPLQCLAHH